MERNMSWHALLIITAWFWIAGTAFAEVPDDNFEMVDANEPEATAEVRASQSQFGAFARVRCAPPENDPGKGTVVMIETEHPDNVKLKDGSASVSQGTKGNFPMVSVEIGSGLGLIRVFLTCEKAKVKTSVSTRKTPFEGNFSAMAKNCVCVTGLNTQEECDGYEARLEQVATDCDGFESIRGSIDVEGAVIRLFKLKGRGRATID